MSLGRILIVFGLVLVAAGLLINFAWRLPLKLGHLPGDILLRGKHGVFYFPLATCILLSVALSFVMWLLKR